ncbi:rhomboid family protein [Lyngbya confervoides]|uniref:Rhomboid family intramembrane serine protease n=1 Tax=Lyngbya confervoides BDU141951 TaxID=1574623 RepID=A0ABD4SZF0_9CYAN|nr:rhomboid family intramembrane serine protease [Lyngbya confervoides]MCM1981774.1 rhomboid family intramembrane serine protease [Lyngbya confervoides BDU141951]
MDIADILLWLIVFSCGLIFWQSLRVSGVKSLWFWVSGGLLILLGLGWNDPTLLGIALLLWAVFLLAPLLGFAQVQRWIRQGDYLRARRWMQGLRLLHPSDSWLQYPRICSAILFAQGGQVQLAHQQLKGLERSLNPLALEAHALVFALEGHWQNCLQWLDQLPAAKHKSLTFSISYCRALVETGQCDQFSAYVEQIAPLLRQNSREVHLLKVVVLALGGQYRSLGQILQRTPLTSDVQRYWLATAAMTGGQTQLALQQFQILLQQTQDPFLHQSIQARIAQPLPAIAPYLSAQTRQILHRIAPEPPQSQRYDFGQRTREFAGMTWLLIGANLAMFTLEVQQGGSQDSATLYQLGGLWPPAVWAGEYWRLVAANFLHSGPVHLGMNMLGLLVLGPFVEKSLGVIRYSLVYAGSGLGAALCIAYLPKFIAVEPEFTVGASGAVMGLVGAIAAITLWGWLVERLSLAGRRFRTVLLMIGIQLAFDLSLENISITGHLSGLASGFLLTLSIILVFGFRGVSSG